MKNKSLDPSHTYVTKVQRLDPLGQGVCFVEGNIVFTPKVIEGEVVKISIESKKKGVYFAKLVEVEEASPKRIPSECTHYDQCRGCDYLHVDYEKEIDNKYQSLLNNFKVFPTQYTIRTHPSNQRFHYRNRIQLHYSLKNFKHPILGLFADNHQKFILKVPGCLLPNLPIQSFLKTFYNEWQNLIPNSEPRTGHVEIYQLQDQVYVAWNKPYAHLGFTQVNEQVNQVLSSLVVTGITEKLQADEKILELFCGHGNLLKSYKGSSQILGVDIEGALPAPHIFKKIDLYEKDALKILKLAVNQQKIGVIILDPPRSGYSGIGELVTHTKPKQLIYISCWVPTLIRDLKEIQASNPWTSMNIELVDMFPGTKHYETVVSIKWS